MKMVARDANAQYLRQLRERLEQNGIPAVVQGENTARMIFSFALFEPTLWIYVDEQFGDAVQLISDPEHVVRTGIDLDGFRQGATGEAPQRADLNRALIHLALFMGLIMSAMLGLIVLLKWLNG
jgi:hypothetical protein